MTTKKGPGRAKNTHLGFLPPDDRIFSMGPIVGGRRLMQPGPNSVLPKEKGEKMPQESGPGTCVDLGYLPDDHPVYRSGPVVSGRPIFPPLKKKGDEHE